MNSGTRSPRSLSSVGRKLLPAMIWYLPLESTRFCVHMISAAGDDKDCCQGPVAVRIEFEAARALVDLLVDQHRDVVDAGLDAEHGDRAEVRPSSRA